LTQDRPPETRAAPVAVRLGAAERLDQLIYVHRLDDRPHNCAVVIRSRWPLAIRVTARSHE
jgi:hypothetical protein